MPNAWTLEDERQYQKYRGKALSKGASEQRAHQVAMEAYEASWQAPANDAPKAEAKKAEPKKEEPGKAEAKKDEPGKAAAKKDEPGKAAKPEPKKDIKVQQQLAEKSKDELYERAQDLDISGRSSMSKDELAEAIAAES